MWRYTRRHADATSEQILRGRLEHHRGRLDAFRLLETKSGQGRGYFELYGWFHRPQLVMDDGGEYGRKFSSGLRFDHASVTLDWQGYTEFKTAC